MPTRKCPVCEDIALIGFGKKTCSDECGRAWRKMSRAEQKARMSRTDIEGITRAALIQIRGEIKDEAIPSQPPRRKDSPMPQGLRNVLGMEKPTVVEKGPLETSEGQLPSRVDPALLPTVDEVDKAEDDESDDEEYI